MGHFGLLALLAKRGKDLLFKLSLDLRSLDTGLHLLLKIF